MHLHRQCKLKQRFFSDNNNGTSLIELIFYLGFMTLIFTLVFQFEVFARKTSSAHMAHLTLLSYSSNTMERITQYVRQANKITLKNSSECELEIPQYAHKPLIFTLKWNKNKQELFAVEHGTKNKNLLGNNLEKLVFQKVSSKQALGLHVKFLCKLSIFEDTVSLSLDREIACQPK